MGCEPFSFDFMYSRNTKWGMERREKRSYGLLVKGRNLWNCPNSQANFGQYSLGNGWARMECFQFQRMSYN
jgi:hypothetical protein